MNIIIHIFIAIITGLLFITEAQAQKQIYNPQGETQRDFFGAQVTQVDDLNFDGLSDFIVSATQDGFITDPGPGYVAVFSGKTGEEIYRVTGSNLFFQFGSRLATAGDVNGDGAGDFWVADSYANEVYLFSGIDGQKIYTVSTSVGTGYGRSLAPIKDINADGITDLLVGAHLIATKERGMVDLLSGFDGALIYHFEDDDSKCESMGTDVLDGGDVNQDGTNDLLIASYGHTTSCSSSYPRGFGYTRVYSGATAELIYEIPALRDGKIKAPRSLASGDFNQDGYSDFAIGQPTYDPYCINLYSGFDGLLLDDICPGANNGGFGETIKDIPDQNGDGVKDLLVGHVYSSGGVVYLYSGATRELLYKWDRRGETTISFLGNSLGCLDDITGDGIAEIIAGAHFSNNFVGQVFVWSGNDLFLNIEPKKAKPGDTVTLTVNGAPPSSALSLFFSSINGVDELNHIENNSFSSLGSYSISELIPSDLPPTTFGFKLYALKPTAAKNKVIESEEELLFIE